MAVAMRQTYRSNTVPSRRGFVEGNRQAVWDDLLDDDED
jgi:hypothetical protein